MDMEKKKRKLSKKSKILIVTVLLLIISTLFALLIFNKGKGSNYKKKTSTTTTTTKKEEPIKIVDVNSNSRPFAVMINNNKAVWGYQAGLQDAYITYEMIVEGGITRLMALFKDKNVSRIASVRSSRHYYLDYALENDAIYAHIGWSPQAQSDISSLGVNAINAV